MDSTQTRQESKGERGAILVAVLLAILALTILGLATIYLSGASNEITVASRAQDQALYVAEAGVNFGIDYTNTNPGAVAAQYATTGYGGGGTDPHIQSAGSDILVSGSGGLATPLIASFKIGTSVDSKGKTVKCGLVGFSDKFGQQRYRIDARGNGPGGAKREIEAHILTPPKEGICPPGNKVVGGYSGG